MGFYRTYAAVSVLLGINIAVRLFNIPIGENLIWGNHFVESAAALSLVTFLSDLRIIDSQTHKTYLKIGLIAFFGGIFMVLASFSTLFVPSNFIPIVGAWFRIAPQIIGLIGIPCLYIADKLSQRNKILGFENVGKRGLLNVVIIATAYSVLVIYFLNKYGLLVL